MISRTYDIIYDIIQRKVPDGDSDRPTTVPTVNGPAVTVGPKENSCTGIISKLGGYYVILFQFSLIMHINSVLCHIMSVLFHLFHLQFLDYYVILCHFPEISYYFNYVSCIISIILFRIIIHIMAIIFLLIHLFHFRFIMSLI